MSMYLKREGEQRNRTVNLFQSQINTFTEGTPSAKALFIPWLFLIRGCRSMRPALSSCMLYCVEKIFEGDKTGM